MRFFNMSGLFHRDGEPLKKAGSIMGKDRFLVGHELKKLFGKVSGSERFVYNLETVRSCAEAPKDEYEWVLYPRHGLSLWQLRERFPKEFCPSSVWDEHPAWLDVAGEPGYRLINLKLHLVDVACGSASFIKYYSPAHLATVAECAIALKKLKGVQFLAQLYHLGIPEGKFVPLIGGDDEEGLLLYKLPESSLELYGQPHCGIVVCRIPDVGPYVP